MAVARTEPSAPQSAAGDAPVLEVRNLKTHFFTRAGVVSAVDDVSFSVGEGETLGIVGESGCGKSVTSLSIMRLIPSPPGKIVGGRSCCGSATPSGIWSSSTMRRCARCAATRSP